MIDAHVHFEKEAIVLNEIRKRCVVGKKHRK